MLKYGIWWTFCHIAFENRFNGSRGLLKIRIMIPHKEIHKFSISTTLIFLGTFANSPITQPLTYKNPKYKQIVAWLKFWCQHRIFILLKNFWIQFQHLKLRKLWNTINKYCITIRAQIFQYNSRFYVFVLRIVLRTKLKFKLRIIQTTNSYQTDVHLLCLDGNDLEVVVSVKSLSPIYLGTRTIVTFVSFWPIKMYVYDFDFTSFSGLDFFKLLSLTLFCLDSWNLVYQILIYFMKLKILFLFYRWNDFLTSKCMELGRPLWNLRIRRMLGMLSYLMEKCGIPSN